MLQTLSPREETAVHRQMQKNAAVACKDIIQEFVACSRDRTVSMAWACRTQRTAMVECMHQRTKEDDLAQAREDYLRERQRARRERQAAVEQKDDQI
ncbi:cytochrome c oxidase biogenesis protein Cmc1 like-domain-containing protein [Protomyces lactucae-debilis]|uniref:COX assembly mitochondrial protein n=1 Tax=Protomyces lactucae-debilis TaxID=2754530 RepID=A0A1Y2FIE7_PROLT|nr:cytochrome c oxidase biogenesis protein Cmc1 like-domain-containing protein [Protomyces lactucae-debilis]ORY83730.1 cytochrome c oxidase biogenesis protein Cmc1 like-domain-containing protein [Protomyces lactucae-debilis]